MIEFLLRPLRLRSVDAIRRRSALLAAAALLLAGCSGPTPEEHFQAAQNHLDRGEINAAEIELKNALQKNPDLAVARRALGNLQLRVGDAATAVKELERALALGLEDPELALELAQARVLTGDPEQAQQLVDQYGDDVDALSVDLATVVARAQALLGRPIESRAILASVLARDPEHVLATLEMARSDYARGNAERALDRVETLVGTSNGAENAQAWLLLGELLLVDTQTDAAIEAMRKAREFTEGDTTLVSISLARALLAGNRTDEARTELDELIARIPNLLPARYMRAAIRFDEEDFETAKGELDAILALAPDHLPSRFLRGLINFRLGAPEQSRDDLQRVVAQNPGNFRARLLLAAIHQQAGENGEAMQVLAEGLNEFQEDPPVEYLVALGQAQLRGGDAAAGLENLQRAAERQPDAAQIRTQLALAHVAMGANEEAETQLLDAVDLSESFPQSDALLVLVQIQSEKFDEALESARRFVERQPEAPLAHNMLGAARLASEDRDGAAAAFRRAVELDPAFAPARLNLAALEQDAGNVDAALTMLAGLLEVQPANRQALGRYVELAVAEGRIDAAIDVSERAIASEPAAQELTLVLARLKARAGDLDGARELLLALPDSDAANDAVIAARAGAARDTGDLAEAARLLEQLRQRRPEDVGVVVQLATTLSASGEADRALRLIDDAIRGNVDTPLPLAGARAGLLLQQGRLEAAADALDELEALGGATPVVARFRGDLAFQQGRFDAARTFYADALERAPAGDLVTKLYAAHQQLGERDQGRAVLEGWLGENPDDAGVLAMLGQHLLGEQALNAARDTYMRLLTLAPDNAVVLNNLAWIHGELGDLEAGIEMARQAAAMAPESNAVMDTLGWLLLQADQPQEALQRLERAARGVDDPDITYHLAVAQSRTGQRDQAIESLRRALASDAAFPARDDARALLAELGGS